MKEWRGKYGEKTDTKKDKQVDNEMTEREKHSAIF